MDYFLGFFEVFILSFMSPVILVNVFEECNAFDYSSKSSSLLRAAISSA